MTDHSYSRTLLEGKETAVTLTGSENTPVPGILTEPAYRTGMAVILCHGFLSDRQSRTNRRLTDLLIPEGIATFRFDWFGMGELQEYFFHLTLQHCFHQMDAIVTYLTDRGFTSLGIVGSSFGGFMTILSISRFPLSFKGVGLKCPVVDFSECLRLEFGEAGMTAWRKTNRIPNIVQGQAFIPLHYRFFEECRQYDGYQEASHMTVPTRVVHGGKDDLIPSHQIERLMQILPGQKDLCLLPEADHQFGRPEDFRIMTVRLTQWMIQHLMPTDPKTT